MIHLAAHAIQSFAVQNRQLQIEFLDGFGETSATFTPIYWNFFSLKVVPVNWNSNCIVTIELLSPPECAHRIPKAPTLIRQFRKELSATHDGNQGDSL
jgi:hypothetical protein